MGGDYTVVDLGLLKEQLIEPRAFESAPANKLWNPCYQRSIYTRFCLSCEL